MISDLVNATQGVFPGEQCWDMAQLALLLPGGRPHPHLLFLTARFQVTLLEVRRAPCSHTTEGGMA